MRMALLACMGCVNSELAFQRPFAIWVPLLIIPWTAGLLKLQREAARVEWAGGVRLWNPGGRDLLARVLILSVLSGGLSLVMFPRPAAALMEFVWGICLVGGMSSAFWWLKHADAGRVARKYLILNAITLTAILAVEVAGAFSANRAGHIVSHLGSLPHPGDQMRTLERLVEKGPAAIPLISAALQDELQSKFKSPCRIGALAYSLSRMDSPDAVRSLYAALAQATDQVPIVREPEILGVLAAACADAGGETARPVLLNLYERGAPDESGTRRAAALLGLLRIGSADAEVRQRLPGGEPDFETLCPELSDCLHRLYSVDLSERRSIILYRDLTRCVDELRLRPSS